MNYILAIAIGYLLGSIPFSYAVPKLTKGIDIRTIGSGNVGATNVFRVCGAKWAFVAFLGDILKGVLATWLCLQLWGEIPGLLAGVFAMLGHCYPYLLGFKGGKGVTTAAGIILIASPVIFALLFVFQVVFIGTTRIVSLSSILAAVLLPIMAIYLKSSDALILFCFVMSLFVIYRHKDNIVRLIRFEEKTISFKKST